MFLTWITGILPSAWSSLREGLETKASSVHLPRALRLFTQVSYPAITSVSVGQSQNKLSDIGEVGLTYQAKNNEEDGP